MAETSGISFEDVLKVAAGKEATAISRLGLGDLPGTLESLGIAPEERARIVQQAGKDVFRLIAGVIHPDVSASEPSEAAFGSLYSAYQAVNSDPQEALREHVLRGDKKLSAAQSGELAEIREQVTNFTAAERLKAAELRYRMPYYSLFGMGQDENIGLRLDPSITNNTLPSVVVRRTKGGNPVLASDDYEGFDVEAFDPMLRAHILISGDSAQVQGLKVINPSREHVPARVFSAYCKNNANQIEDIEADIANLFKTCRIIGSFVFDPKSDKAAESSANLELNQSIPPAPLTLKEVIDTPPRLFRSLDKLLPFMEKAAVEPSYLVMARRTPSGELNLGVAGTYTTGV